MSGPGALGNRDEVAIYDCLHGILVVVIALVIGVVVVFIIIIIIIICNYFLELQYFL